MDELALDQCFWREVRTSPTFLDWLIGHTKFSGRTLELVTDEKWHHRWYRNPETHKDSETDILLIFSSAENEGRLALHIENKPPHGKWRENQPENYRKRAVNRMSAWHYVDFQTALLAPAAFIQRHAVEAAQLDFLLHYEEVGKFIPEFGAACQVQG